MGEYSKKGSYAGYDKDHLDRADLDYYATPPEEVENILEKEGLDYSCCPGTPTIWEPCCGGGHMAEGILRYLKDDPNTFNICLTDLVDRKADIYLHNTLIGVKIKWYMPLMELICLTNAKSIQTQIIS